MSATNDRELLDLIRRDGPLTVAEMATKLGVTATAVRNRLVRLSAAGMVERHAEVTGRGRPRHAYQVSVLARKRLGQTYTELAVALWGEMMVAVEDKKLRRLLFARIVDRLADQFRAQVKGNQWQGRMVELGSILHDRGVETEVTASENGSDPILKQHSCPYYELAEVDRAVCALERKMFEKVVGQGLRLSQCRLDGHRSCDFEAKPVVTIGPMPREAI
ncbi:MAG: AsnC family transcriptional regulator [Planctomycetota bacterium]|nr:AsnC family transcriptional regulator [Planctomycetota bacterium]